MNKQNTLHKPRKAGLKPAALSCISIFLFIGTAGAIPMFEEESAEHFIWNSGPIAERTSEFSLFTIFPATGIAADYMELFSPESVVFIHADGAALLTRLHSVPSDGITGDGAYTLFSDTIGFYSIAATYENVVPRQQIGNVRVEGWLVDPGANNVPESGSTLMMLGMVMAGLVMRRRR